MLKLKKAKKTTYMLDNDKQGPFVSGHFPTIVNKTDFYPPKNAKRRPTKIIEIKIDDIEPLETQRIVTGNWAKKMYTNHNGIDWMMFQTLSVAEVDGEYKVWDGNGRLLLAKLAYEKDPTIGDTVPCIVTKMTKSEAAKAFSYTQGEGRRNLSKESVYINDYVGKTESSIKTANVMEHIGVYTKGDTNYYVPSSNDDGERPHPDAIEIKIRTMEVGNKIVKGDKDIQRWGIKTIDYIARGQTLNLIPQDLYWTIIKFCYIYKDEFLTKKKLNNNNINPKELFTNYLLAKADADPIKKVASNNWKAETRQSGNSTAVAKMVKNLYASFKEWVMSKDEYKGGKFASVFPEKKLHNL